MQNEGVIKPVRDRKRQKLIATTEGRFSSLIMDTFSNSFVVRSFFLI